MGDVGSAFLGFSFAVLPLVAKNERADDDSTSRLLPLIAISLVWLFFFDTVSTFLRRVLKREKVWQAHRGHIYQKLVISGYTHRFVSILYGMASGLTVIFLIYGLRQKENPLSEIVFIIILQPLVILGVLYFSKTETI